MRKAILLVLSIAAIYNIALGQVRTSQQMSPMQSQQMQNLTPDQLAEYKRLQNQPNKLQPNSNKRITKDSESYSSESFYQRDTNILTYGDDYKIRDLNIRDSLKVYGREIFSQKNLTFSPSLNLPTPENYVLAAGDELNISVWGSAEQDYKVRISPDGFINLSGMGLIQVSGLSVRTAESRIKERLMQKVEGIGQGNVFVNVALGNIRSIKVNISGEALVPGTYTLPSLATLFNALYVAGGVSSIGSVREIKLYRKGKLMSTLDVYDYLLKGKLDVDARLEDNDLIVVEPYHNLVCIQGEVKRPMIYEMKNTETLETLIKYTGGFTGSAFSENLSVTRSATGKDMQFFTIGKAGFQYFPMMDNDSVWVGRITDTYANRVTVVGAVWRSGNYELNDSINTVKTLVKAANGPRPEAFTGRSQVIRTKDDRTRELISLNLQDILDGKTQDIPLMGNDSLIVTPYNALIQQRTLSIKGEVNNEVTFEYYAGIKIADVIMKAGGFKESASMARLEVSRRVTNPEATSPSPTISETFSFKINGDLSMTPQSLDFSLMPFDIIYVRRSPGYNEQKQVYLEGEVVFDGEYTLASNNVTLSQIIKKAGGVTPQANIRGAYLRRKKTEFDVERERSVDKLLESGKKTEKDTILLEKIAVGSYYSVAINLEKAFANPGSLDDIILKEGDRLVIPTFSSTVKITGGVYYPNTVTYVPGKKINDYISMAGGYNQRARRTPFVIYQNGMVAAKGARKIEPGCEIVVPQKPEKRVMSAGEWMSLGTSVVSMAAMITSLLR